VLPSFHQTAWLVLLCALVAVVLLWLLFVLRVRAITRVFRARAEERADERIRIARELHDTLLQGLQGLLLTFHVATQKMSANDESRAMLEHALSTADRLIIEGRNRVESLRSEHVTDAELVGAVRNAANDLDPDRRVRFRVKRSGIDARLHSHVSDEVFFMAREALANAFRHAAASQIGLELDYGRRFFTLACEDDGRGFGPEARERAGHWGLDGIEERARRLGGRSGIRSEPGRGTRITVVIPSYQAYRRHSRLMFYLRAWRFSERNPLNRARGGPPPL
jgi:signal transduction histidine kinase